MSQIETFENLTRFREPLIGKIINHLSINTDSKGLDVGCGIGQITYLLSERLGKNGNITGLDYSPDFITHANQKYKKDNVDFIQGDINHLKLPSNFYDWIWSMDTVWAGPKKFGCPAKEPDKILDQLNNILKPGGKIYLLYWTSQKFLPGYPLLESRLNATTSANAPYLDEMKPYTHVMNGKKWLKNAKFSKIQVNTFVGDIVAPLNEKEKDALSVFFQMFWGDSQKEVSQNDWRKFNEICIPDSNQYILYNPDYYGYYTYTLFEGEKVDR